MSTPGIPRGINFVYEQAERALKDQFAWIDALDAKAGVLLAADGVIVGLMISNDSFLRRVPRFSAALIVFLLLTSLVLALLSFATRNYELAPDVSSLLPQMTHSGDELLRSAALPTLLRALDVNEPKVNKKAAFIAYSGLALLAGVLLFGTHFVYFLIDP